jgi:hypothetical protein
VIFNGQSLQTTWFKSDSVPDWFYTTSENEWTSNTIGLEWLHRIFIPESTTTPGAHRLLLLDGHGSHVTTHFMATCYQNQIHYLYLPAHSSHILQILDPSPFSVTKTKYRQQIRDLTWLNDATPVKKERCIDCYYNARLSELLPRVIRAGWRATGLVPYNLNLVLSSSQVRTRPVTPPRLLQPIYLSITVITTPQRSQDLYKAGQLLGQSEKLSRDTRLLLGKACKAISAANTRVAELRASNQRLLHQLDKAHIKLPRKRVRADPNQRFSDQDAIRAAISQAAAQAAKKTTKQRDKKRSRL